MHLHDLKPKPGARRREKRIGCGPGSGHGKTATKGHKGQLARSGGGKGPGFEGGQQPLTRRIPKRGFHPYRRQRWATVSIEQLGRLKGKSEVTPEQLRDTGLVKDPAAKIKVLGDGQLAGAMTVTAHAFSASAKEKITAAGGTVKVLA